MPYTSIPRGSGGSPLPVRWNSTTGNWEVIEGALVDSNQNEAELKQADDGSYLLGTAGYGMTEGGVWIPRKVTDDGYDKVTQSGSKVAHTVISGDTIVASATKYYEVDVENAFQTGIKNLIITISGDGDGEIDVQITNYDPDYTKNRIENSQKLIDIASITMNNTEYPFVYTIPEFVRGIRIRLTESEGINDITNLKVELKSYTGGANI